MAYAMSDLCAKCRRRAAHPEAFGLCPDCDDLPQLNAFDAVSNVTDHTIPMPTLRETLEHR
jgi:hypothetical protein